jgi:NADH-ubiquinone oxidoreductase chain 4
MVWGNLGYMFGCDYISYGLILLSFWICVLKITARESVFRSSYYPGLFMGWDAHLAMLTNSRLKA